MQVSFSSNGSKFTNSFSLLAANMKLTRDVILKFLNFDQLDSMTTTYSDSLSLSLSLSLLILENHKLTCGTIWWNLVLITEYWMANNQVGSF